MYLSDDIGVVTGIAELATPLQKTGEWQAKY